MSAETVVMEIRRYVGMQNRRDGDELAHGRAEGIEPELAPETTEGAAAAARAAWLRWQGGAGPKEGIARKRDTVEAWGAFLGSIPWDLWCTWTFDRPVGYESGARAVRRWLGRVEGKAGGAEFGWVLAAEKPQGHAWPHWHGLVVGVEPSTWVWPHWQAWVTREGMGRFVRIEGGREAVSLYCAKGAYLTKDPGCEMELGPNLGPWMGRAASPRVSLFPAHGKGERVTRSELGPLADDVNRRFVWREERGGWTLGHGDEARQTVARVYERNPREYWAMVAADRGRKGGTLGPFATMGQARREVAFALDPEPLTGISGVVKMSSHGNPADARPGHGERT